MLIYILNIITIPLYALFIKNRKKFIILVAIQLFLILALRDITMGVDMSNYIPGYAYISKMDFSELVGSLRLNGVSELVWPYYYENGYTILNWIVSHLGLSFHALLVVCAAINIGSVSYFIYRYSKKPWLSFIIFCALGFYMSTFGLLRHSLALSMCLLSYCFLDKKKYIISIIMFLVALTFHRTAILFLPILLLLVFPIKNMSRRKFLCLLLIGFVILILAVPINNVLSQIMVSMGKNYINSEDIEANKKIVIFTIYSLLMVLAYNFGKIKSRTENISCFAMIFTIWFTVVGLYNPILTRALPFYSIFLILLIPDMFEQYKDQKSIVILEAVAVVLLVIYMYSITSGSAIDPYIIYQGVLA